MHSKTRVFSSHNVHQYKLPNSCKLFSAVLINLLTGTNDSTTVVGSSFSSFQSSRRFRALVFNSSSFSAHYFINSFTPTSLDLSIHSPSTSLYVIQCLHGLKLHSRIHERDQPDCDSHTLRAQRKVGWNFLANEKMKVEAMLRVKSRQNCSSLIIDLYRIWGIPVMVLQESSTCMHTNLRSHV